MTRENINTGIEPNDGKGDSLRVSFTKVNNNFIEMYTQYANVNARISNTWISPQTSNAFNVITVSGATRVSLPASNVAYLNTTTTRAETGDSVYIPKNVSTTSILEPIFNGSKETLQFLITVSGNTSEGSISNYNSDEWILTYNDDPVSYSNNANVSIQLTYIREPQPWFDPTALGFTNFRGAKLDYHAYVDNTEGFNRIGQIIYSAGDNLYNSNDLYIDSTQQVQNVDVSIRQGTDKLHYKNISTIAVGNLHIQWSGTIWLGRDRAYTNE
jgi:hypothetical protein